MREMHGSVQPKEKPAVRVRDGREAIRPNTASGHRSGERGQPPPKKKSFQAKEQNRDSRGGISACVPGSVFLKEGSVCCFSKASAR